MKDVGSSNGEMMRRGRVEVVCGSMFSGKTEELIRRLRRAQFAKQKVEIFKPAIDVRYSEEEVVSHEGNSIPSTPVDSSASILLMAQESDVVGIDEAQFFDEHIVEVCNELASRGIRVIVAGLDLERCMPSVSVAEHWPTLVIALWQARSKSFLVRNKNTNRFAGSVMPKP